MIDFKQFPVTRYQGSKRKIAPWIYEHIKDLEFNTALDACGGSGTVSYLMKKMGKEVTYNDKLKFNHLIGKALIENNKVLFTDRDVDNLIQWTDENEFDNFIERTFRDVYYLRNENKWLDGMANGIINMNHYRGATLDYKKSIAYYALFQACIIKRPFNLFHRKNLNIRTRDVVRKFGNKTTWEKPFEDLFRKFVLEANSSVFNSGVDCRALNLSIFDIPDDGYDLVYIDPPYIAQESTNEAANYLKSYHFLEGIANYNEWENLINYDTPNLRFGNVEWQNDFDELTITKTLEKMVSKFRDSTIVISYKEGGKPSINKLKEIVGKHKNRVYTRTKAYSYALNRSWSHHQKRCKEVLIIGI